MQGVLWATSCAGGSIWDQSRILGSVLRMLTCVAIVPLMWGAEGQGSTPGAVSSGKLIPSISLCLPIVRSNPSPCLGVHGERGKDFSPCSSSSSHARSPTLLTSFPSYPPENRSFRIQRDPLESSTEIPHSSSWVNPSLPGPLLLSQS